jgi:heme oxygenase
LQEVDVNTLSLPERLKRETAEVHKSVEKRLDLLRDGFTRADYSQLLARFYGFYEPWERAALPLMREWDPALFEGRLKSPALAADLRFFGIEPGSLPRCDNLPAMDSLAAVLGSAYVLEGATLGGNFLSGHFRNRLSLPSDALHFYTVYGAQTGSMWILFRQALERAESCAPAETFITSARSTFEAITAWLTRDTPTL